MLSLPALSTPAVVHAMRRGHAWLAESAGVGLTFAASLGSRSVSCGERLLATAAGLVDVRLRVSGAPTCVAQVLNTLDGVPGHAMVAMTNKVFLG